MDRHAAWLIVFDKQRPAAQQEEPDKFSLSAGTSFRVDSLKMGTRRVMTDIKQLGRANQAFSLHQELSQAGFSERKAVHTFKQFRWSLRARLRVGYEHNCGWRFQI